MLDMYVWLKICYHFGIYHLLSASIKQRMLKKCEKNINKRRNKEGGIGENGEKFQVQCISER